MRLRVHLISRGKYYEAGTDIPDDDLPEFATKYASEEIQQQRNDADAVEWRPQAKLSSRRYVKREGAFKRAGSVEMIPGEPLYKRDLNATSPRYVRYGRVGSQ
jgi:hypothetical protein